MKFIKEVLLASLFSIGAAVCGAEISDLESILTVHDQPAAVQNVNVTMQSSQSTCSLPKTEPSSISFISKSDNYAFDYILNNSRSLSGVSNLRISTENNESIEFGVSNLGNYIVSSADLRFKFGSDVHLRFDSDNNFLYESGLPVLPVSVNFSGNKTNRNLLFSLPVAGFRLDISPNRMGSISRSFKTESGEIYSGFSLDTLTHKSSFDINFNSKRDIHFVYHTSFANYKDGSLDGSSFDMGTRKIKLRFYHGDRYMAGKRLNDGGFYFMYGNFN